MHFSYRGYWSFSSLRFASLLLLLFSSPPLPLCNGLPVLWGLAKWTYSFWREGRADQIGVRDCRPWQPPLFRFSLSLDDLRHVAHSSLWNFSLSYPWNSSVSQWNKLSCFLYVPLKNLWPERLLRYIKIRGLKQQSHLDICPWNRYSKHAVVSVIPLRSKSTLEALKSPTHIPHPVSDVNGADQSHFGASTSPQGMTIIISSNCFFLGGCLTCAMGCWSSDPSLGGPLKAPSQTQLLLCHCLTVPWMLQTPALTPAKTHKGEHDPVGAAYVSPPYGGILMLPDADFLCKDSWH